MQAIRVSEYGGPEALAYQELPTPVPGPGEALIKIEAVGINYIDVYHRTGLYPSPQPFTPGVEAAGTVAAVGAEVNGLREGDRVAYVGVQGAYAEYAVVPAGRLVPIPDGLDAQQAAAALLQGMTAHVLVSDTYAIKPGDRILVHAAAGGVGLLLVQLAKQRGAEVFGTVSTEQKAALARAAGADHIIMYTQDDFAAEVKRLTEGQGLHVVYDSVGRTTFDHSLDCLRPRGLLVLFGQSSGPVPPFSPSVLANKGSLFLTRPTLFHYIAERAELLRHAGAVLSRLLSGNLQVRVDQTFPLASAADAHRRLEGRESSGKLLLLP